MPTDFTERLGYTLYLSALAANLEARHEWTIIRDEYLVFAATFMELCFTGSPNVLSNHLPQQSQSHPYSDRG